MKKHVLLILSMLLITAFTGVGSLQADVIEDENTYIDVGVESDVVNVEIINEVSGIYTINATAITINYDKVSVEPVTFNQKSQKRITENRESFKHMYNYRVVPWRISTNAIK